MSVSISNERVRRVLRRVVEKLRQSAQRLDLTRARMRGESLRFDYALAAEAIREAARLIDRYVQP